MNIIASYLVSSFFLVYSFSGLVTISSRNELHANKHNRKECNYGLESGSWKDGNNGDRWEVISSRCSLTNFLTKFTNSSDSPFPVRMLFLGDSLDRNTMEDTCLFYDGKNHRDSSPKNFSSPHNCSYGNISIIFRYIPGVSIDGPFFQAIDGNPPSKWQESSFIGRSIETKKMFFDLYKDHPNIVVLSSNYWDLARLASVENYSGEYIHQSILESYQKNLTLWIHHIKQLYRQTSTMILFHSHARPGYNLYTGRLLYGAFGSFTLRSWQQLNAQSRFISIQEHLRFVDVEAMSVAVPQRSLLRLDDPLHPQPWFNLDVFNIYLNHLADHLAYNKTE